jgi:hypothetical protein
VFAGRRTTFLVMKQSDIFRDNADNCLILAEHADGQASFRRYSRMAQAWRALAHEQDWLDGEISPLPRIPARAQPPLHPGRVA